MSAMLNLLLIFAILLYGFAISSEAYADDHITIEKMLILDEDLSKTPYRDIDGSTVIGVGRNLSSVGISKEEAIMLLRNDIARVEKELTNDKVVGAIYQSLDENRKLAIKNMCFNLGITKLRGFDKMWKALASKDYNKAAIEAKNSKWYKDVSTRGLRIIHIIQFGNLNSYKVAR